MAADDDQHRDLDAPAPPGSPMRRDAPDANVVPGPQATTRATTVPDQPDVQPSGTPDGPQVVPSPSTPEGEPGPDPDTAPEPATQPTETGAQPPTQAQIENAESSLDEPSDNSGAE